MEVTSGHWQVFIMDKNEKPHENKNYSFKTLVINTAIALQEKQAKELWLLI